MVKLKQILLETYEWEKQSEWHGNPSLGLTSYRKFFVNPNDNRKVPVYLFGKGSKWLFTVSAGTKSEFSYTGGFPTNITITTLKDRMNYIDSLANDKYDTNSGFTLSKKITNKLFK